MAAGVEAPARAGLVLRPSMQRPKANDLGLFLGRSRNVECFASVEDSMVILGPPRSGKGYNLVIPFILDAPGAVVTTSTRPDNLAVTMNARMKLGPGRCLRPAGPRQRRGRGTALVAHSRVRAPRDGDAARRGALCGRRGPRDRRELLAATDRSRGALSLAGGRRRWARCYRSLPLELVARRGERSRRDPAGLATGDAALGEGPGRPSSGSNRANAPTSGRS